MTNNYYYSHMKIKNDNKHLKQWYKTLNQGKSLALSTSKQNEMDDDLSDLKNTRDLGVTLYMGKMHPNRSPN